MAKSRGPGVLVWNLYGKNAKKQRKPNGFSIFSATYCKHHRFYKVFEHSGCKNQGKLVVFHYIQQNIAKTTSFIRFLTTLGAKTKESQWFFNMFSKILQKQLVLYGFWALWMQKQRKTIGFSIFSGKYCKNHWFYKVLV